MALLDRLENDRSLARFAGQFVPLKIVTDNNPDWAKWSRKYSVDGRGIPQIYVVRADGEQIFGAVGSLPGNQLPQMMLAALQQAGPFFNDAQAKTLSETSTAARSALTEDNLLKTAVLLANATAMVPLDDAQSFAAPAVELRTLYQELRGKMDERVSKAKEDLSGSEQANHFPSLLALAETIESLELFAKWKPDAISLAREIKQDEKLADQWAQAEAIVKARMQSASTKLSIQRRALTAYAGVIRRFPGTDAERLAREELAALDPDAKILHSADETPEDWDEKPTEMEAYREWTARSGKFKTKAKFLQAKAGKVQLQKPDGSKIVVDIDQLSDEDQAFLKLR